MSEHHSPVTADADTPTIAATFRAADWFGEWVSFERFIDSEEPAMIRAWQQAEEASASSPMAARGLRAFWSVACATVSPQHGMPVAGWTVSACPKHAEDGFTVEWFAASGTSLGRHDYRCVDVLARGLEGRPTLVFHADTPDATHTPGDSTGSADADATADPFAWLIAIPPMPSRSERLDGGLLSHLHFQYAAERDTLIDAATGTLRRNRWYPTMCDASGSLLDRCNIVRALHRLPAWTALPDDIEQRPTPADDVRSA